MVIKAERVLFVSTLAKTNKQTKKKNKFKKSAPKALLEISMEEQPMCSPGGWRFH